MKYENLFRTVIKYFFFFFDSYVTYMAYVTHLRLYNYLVTLISTSARSKTRSRRQQTILFTAGDFRMGNFKSHILC